MQIKQHSMEPHGVVKRRSRKTPAKPQSAQFAEFAPLTFSEKDDVLYLHFGTEWVQGAMSIRQPDWLELEYARYMMSWMLFQEKPKQIGQLGLGSGALTKFCYRQFPGAQVTAVELNPAVISVCRVMFKLPSNNDRLTVLERDAMDFVGDSNNHARYDVLQTDLFDADVQGPVLDTVEFYKRCADCLAPTGVMTVNLFAAQSNYAKSISALRQAFAEVICLPPISAGNVVALGFKSRPALDYEKLRARAFLIASATGLPARSWVDGLQFWQVAQEKPQEKES